MLSCSTSRTRTTASAAGSERFRFCDSAIAGAGPLTPAALASNLLAFETDLAEHCSQLSSYMGGDGVRLWPERRDAFFVNDVDSQVAFDRDAATKIR